MLFTQRSVKRIAARAIGTLGATAAGCGGKTVSANTVAAGGVEAAAAAVEGNMGLAAAIWCSQQVAELVGEHS